RIDAARERPAAAEPIAAFGRDRATARKHQRRADEIVARYGPDLVLRLVPRDRHNPVVAGEIGGDPGGRAAAFGENGAELDQRAIGKLAAADPARLQHAEDSAGVKLGEGFIGNAA